MSMYGSLILKQWLTEPFKTGPWTPLRLKEGSSPRDHPEILEQWQTSIIVTCNEPKRGPLRSKWKPSTLHGYSSSTGSDSTPTEYSAEKDTLEADILIRPSASALVCDKRDLIEKIADFSLDDITSHFTGGSGVKTIPHPGLIDTDPCGLPTKPNNKRAGSLIGPPSNKRHSTTTSQVQQPYWGCPFSKHVPKRYGFVYNSCTHRPGVPNLKRIMEHLRKVHSSQLWCESCLKRFQNPDVKAAHGSSTRCQKKQPTECDPERMTAAQEKIFAAGLNDRTAQGEDIWHEIFQFLFPNDPGRNSSTVSPYYDYCLLKHQQDDTRYTTNATALGLVAVHRFEDQRTSVSPHECHSLEDMLHLGKGNSSSSSSHQEPSVSPLSGFDPQVLGDDYDENDNAVDPIALIKRPFLPRDKVATRNLGKFPEPARETRIMDDPEQSLLELYLNDEAWS